MHAVQSQPLSRGDISLDEFSENEGADKSEVPPSPTNNIDVSPVPTLRTPAAPAQTVQNLHAERSRECAQFGEEARDEIHEPASCYASLQMSPHPSAYTFCGLHADSVLGEATLDIV
ncbi:mlkA [Symbiodinium sp. CCMP2592]|nr:mlkA [Symbiodinium sp. CCMP2592]